MRDGPHHHLGTAAAAPAPNARTEASWINPADAHVRQSRLVPAQNRRVSNSGRYPEKVYIHNVIGRPQPGPEVARRDFADWELVALQTPLAIPSPDRIWSEDEWVQINRGHRSHNMDDKWNGFVEEHRLYLHRSWTGRGIYEVKFQPMSGECESLLLEVIIEAVFLAQWPEAKLEAVVGCLRRKDRIDEPSWKCRYRAVLKNAPDDGSVCHRRGHREPRFGFSATTGPGEGVPYQRRIGVTSWIRTADQLLERGQRPRTSFTSTRQRGTNIA